MREQDGRMSWLNIGRYHRRRRRRRVKTVYALAAAYCRPTLLLKTNDVIDNAVWNLCSVRSWKKPDDRCHRCHHHQHHRPLPTHHHHHSAIIVNTAATSTSIIAADTASITYCNRHNNRCHRFRRPLRPSSLPPPPQRNRYRSRQRNRCRRCRQRNRSCRRRRRRCSYIYLFRFYWYNDKCFIRISSTIEKSLRKTT